MNRIDKTFQKEHKLLSIYFSAGHPELEDTLPIVCALQESGVDMVEIGLPFSDPLADGPTIQKSSTRALRNGMTTEKLFDQLRNIRESINIPLVLMGYFNPIMQFGIERFCENSQNVGIDGLIIVDLPPEEDKLINSYTTKHNVHNIRLVTPTTHKTRLKKILKHSSGFLYYVSIMGITGTKKPSIEHLKKKVGDIKKKTLLPFYLLFIKIFINIRSF